MNTNIRNTPAGIAASLILFSAAATSTAFAEEPRIDAYEALPIETEVVERHEIKAVYTEARPNLDELRKRRRANHAALKALSPAEMLVGDYKVALERLTSERGEVDADTDDMRERIRAEVSAILSEASLDANDFAFAAPVAPTVATVAFNPALPLAD